MEHQDHNSPAVSDVIDFKPLATSTQKLNPTGMGNDSPAPADCAEDTQDSEPKSPSLLRDREYCPHYY
jgi:hypothetical protein